MVKYLDTSGPYLSVNILYVSIKSRNNMLTLVNSKPSIFPQLVMLSFSVTVSVHVSGHFQSCQYVFFKCGLQTWFTKSTCGLTNYVYNVLNVIVSKYLLLLQYCPGHGESRASDVSKMVKHPYVQVKT